MTRATLAKEPHDVATMFDGVAKRYDLTNTVLSFAQDRRWRRCTRDALGLRPGERVLDVAAGTGVSTAELARSGAQAVACFFPPTDFLNWREPGDDQVGIGPTGGQFKAAFGPRSTEPEVPHGVLPPHVGGRRDGRCIQLAGCAADFCSCL